MCGVMLELDYDKIHSDGSRTKAYECAFKKATYFGYQHGEYCIVYSQEKNGEISSIEYYYGTDMELSVENHVSALYHSGKEIISYKRRLSVKEAIRLIKKAPGLLTVS